MKLRISSAKTTSLSLTFDADSSVEHVITLPATERHSRNISIDRLERHPETLIQKRQDYRARLRMPSNGRQVENQPALLL